MYVKNPLISLCESTNPVGIFPSPMACPRYASLPLQVSLTLLFYHPNGLKITRNYQVHSNSKLTISLLRRHQRPLGTPSRLSRSHLAPDKRRGTERIQPERAPPGASVGGSPVEEPHRMVRRRALVREVQVVQHQRREQGLGGTDVEGDVGGVTFR